MSGIGLLLALLFDWAGAGGVVTVGLYGLAIISGGYLVVIAAVKGAAKQRYLNIDALVIIATLGAIYINQLAEAAAVVFFFSLAEVFESYGIERSRKALESLVKRSPRVATLKDDRQVKVSQVKVKDVVVVRPGELVPLDGKVLKGNSSVDEATITGEPIPKDKREGDKVFAGTMNQNGYLEIEVSKTSEHSTFAKIIQLVEQAQRSRAPAQAFIDAFAKYYTPAVVIGAVLMAGVPPLFFGGVFAEWFERALVMLVIACPCALVISTPVSIASAIGGASRRGVLIKGGKYLEALAKVKVAAFDKTRTLTRGEPYISDVITFNGFSEEQVLADAAGIEKFSSHPLSRSILDFAKRKGITPHQMEEYRHVEGKGGQATCLVCNDLQHCVGNLKLMEDNKVSTAEVWAKTKQFEQEGKTVVLVSEGDQVMGALAISDKIRKEAAPALKQLGKLGIKAVMVTGDNEHTADYVGKKLGISDINASLLPDEKVEKIKQLKARSGAVVMVGDGVNDAPSLVTATVGMAMGAGGSDVAVETADVALMNSNLLNVPYSIRLGKKTVRTIKQNIAVSLGVKAIFLGLAVFGFAHLELAVAIDAGIAILVVLYSLRLYRFDERAGGSIIHNRSDLTV